MEEIVTIHSKVHKKQKNMTKNIIHKSLNQSSSKISKKINSHSLNNSTETEKKIDNMSRNNNKEDTKKNRSQKKFNNKNSQYNKYGFEEQLEHSLLIKNNNNKNNLSEKNIKNEEEEPDTPVIKLQRNKKPNYLRKSEFIKDKSLTPQEKSLQNYLCPIYDFYKGNSGFNTTKNDNLLKGTSFTQYYNNFKSNNNIQYNDYYNQVNSPNINLSEKNKLNYYFDFSFMEKKQIGKEYFEQENINQINDIPHNKSSVSNIKDNNNNNQIYTKEKEVNYSNIKNELQNIETNNPLNIGKEISHSDDFSDENDKKYNKSPIKYKQMNVNININNNSQNNNIYYQLPNIINHYNNSHNNYFNNNTNNNNDFSFNNNNNGENDTFSEHLNRIINSGNNNININNNNLSNNKNLSNNNIYNNKDTPIGNIFNNRDQNNIKTQDYVNNPIGQHNLLIQNINRNQNQVEDKNNRLSQLSILNQQIENFLKQCSKVNNNNNTNNIKMNDMTLTNNNYNINYNNNNNDNFGSTTKAYINNNVNQNIYNNNNGNINQIQMLNQQMNNNNEIVNQMQNYLNNPGRIGFQNSNNINPNNQIYNTNYYMNNINNINNNFNQNYYNDNINLNNSMNYFYPYNNYSLSELILYKLTPIQLAQQCHIIAKNQNGCRYLQNCITTNPELLNHFFFPKILEHINELSNDQFANYLVKKVFQYLTEDMLLQLIQRLMPVIDQIGTNQYGTRVLQDLIDFLNTDKIFLAFINIIIPHVKLLVIDLNGSHIIYKLILTKNRNVKIIENIICSQVKDIAITRKGCSFLKKYFDFANENELIKIKQCILKDLKEIITDQYGNYVIQNILMKENSKIVKEFLNEIIKNIVFYSNNKFSSNAVEKCFENETNKNIILDLFIKKEIFEKIILDKFGNYVVQKAIAKADKNRRNIMLKLLIPLIPNLKSQYFGQRLLSKLNLQYPNLNINL